MPGIKYKGKDGEWHLLNQVMVNEVNVVQTTGTSSADVMSQSAVTEAIEDITPESLGNGIGTCETSAETIAKEVDIEGYKITQNGFVSITFENDVPSGATLNINNQGAKPIYHKGAPIEDDVISSGDTVMFGYDGSHYVVSSLGGGSTVNFNETVNISLTHVGGNSADLIGASVTITDDDSRATLYTATWTGTTLTTEINVNTNYTVSVDTISGYLTCSDQSYTASPMKVRNVEFVYRYLGVYIESTEHILYTRQNWEATKIANSIVIISTSAQFRIGLEEFLLPIHSNYTDPIENYIPATNVDDYNGSENTQKLIAFNIAYGTNTTDYAGPYSRNYVFPDGTKNGYVPAYGQLKIVSDNITEVNNCLNTCYGTAITSNYNWSSNYIKPGAYMHCGVINSNGLATVRIDNLGVNKAYVRPFADYS